MAHTRNRTEGVTRQMAAEVVVIGSGPGGAVTAMLCAEAGKSVLLVEEGKIYRSNGRHIFRVTRSCTNTGMPA